LTPEVEISGHPRHHPAIAGNPFRRNTAKIRAGHWRENSFADHGWWDAPEESAAGSDPPEPAVGKGPLGSGILSWQKPSG